MIFIIYKQNKLPYKSNINYNNPISLLPLVKIANLQKFGDDALQSRDLLLARHWEEPRPSEGMFRPCTLSTYSTVR